MAIGRPIRASQQGGVSALAEPAPFRFTVATFHRLIDAGVLEEDARVELLGGELIAMSPPGEQHVGSLNRLTHRVRQQVSLDLLVSVQNPIRLTDESEPQPDLAIVYDRGPRMGIPTAADALLLIEVSDSSRSYDREEKLPRYAASGIPEVWLADLVDRLVERHSEPHQGVYRHRAIFRPGETVTSTVLPDIAIPVAELFP